MAKRIGTLGAALVLAAVIAQTTPARVGEPPRAPERAGAPIAYGDFDGDSCEDLAVGAPARVAPGESRTEGAVEILYGRGARCRPTSPVATVRPPALGAGSEPGADARVQGFGAAVAAGDFDRDGFDDLAVTATLLPEFLAEVFVLRGSAAGLSGAGAARMSSLFPRDSHTELLRAQALTVADFDADGADDVAVALSAFWRYELAILFGRGSRGGALDFALARGRFEAPGATDERLRLTSGDFDHDGFDDLALGRPDAAEVRFHYAGPDSGLDLASWRTVTTVVPTRHTP